MTDSLRFNRVFDGECWHGPSEIRLAQGVVEAIEPLPDGDYIRGVLVPGFIDCQVNGGGGYLFNNHPLFETLQAMSEAHARYGTTGFLPTVITDDCETMAQAAEAVARAQLHPELGVLGIHFEGPHLSLSKKGVHAATHLRGISSQEWKLYQREDLGLKMVTLAPEVVSSEEIRELVRLGVQVSLGHSNADFELVQQALDAGASGFTHLYNAMSGLGSREPGMVGAALNCDRAWCGIIVDGHHVHPQSLKLALKAKAKGKLCLVTDAMSFAGSNTEAISFNGGEIYKRGDRLTNSENRLAGSNLTMQSALNNALELLGLPLEEALKMASLYPAQWLGKGTQKGRIAPGFDADWVLLDKAHRVQQSWRAGVASSQAQPE